MRHVYFVAETKGSLSSMQLRKVEEAKIECTRKFFAELNRDHDETVNYDVVTDYSQLLQLVTGDDEDPSFATASVAGGATSTFLFGDESV